MAIPAYSSADFARHLTAAAAASKGPGILGRVVSGLGRAVKSLSSTLRGAASAAGEQIASLRRELGARRMPPGRHPTPISGRTTTMVRVKISYGDLGSVWRVITVSTRTTDDADALHRVLMDAAERYARGRTEDVSAGFKGNGTVMEIKY